MCLKEMLQRFEAQELDARATSCVTWDVAWKTDVAEEVIETLDC